MRLAENLLLLPIAREGGNTLNLVLAWDETNLVLVDAGLPEQGELIAAAIKAEGFDPAKLTHIILTHQDIDHTGAVAELQKMSPGLNVVAHTDEAPYIDGRELPIKLAARLKNYDSLPPEGKEGIDSWRNFYENNPIEVHHKVTDDEILPICGGIKIIHTPGHTPGHICVLFEESNIMVLGDSANVQDGEIVGFNPIYINDMDEAERSLAKIKSHNLSGVVAYHTGWLSLG